MAMMIVGLVVFFAAHLVPLARPLRAGAVAALGAGGYRATFSLVSGIGVVLIVIGYGRWRWSGSSLLYQPPEWGAHLALALMALSFVAIAAAYTRSHLRKALKHPMLVGIKLWALAHLLANGDMASLVLFLSFLAWAVVDRISLKRRERAGEIAPTAFEPVWGGDLAALAVGLAVYALFVWKLHLWLIGVSPLAAVAVS